MLVIPIDRISLLLAQASDVAVPEVKDLEEGELAVEEETNDLAEDVADAMSSYRALGDALEALSPDETYELLALAALGESGDDGDSWDLAVERARSIVAERVLDELRRVLLLTDAIEIGLARLGYSLPETSEEEEEEGDAEQDEEEVEVDLDTEAESKKETAV